LINSKFKNIFTFYKKNDKKYNQTLDKQIIEEFQKKAEEPKPKATQKK